MIPESARFFVSGKEMVIPDTVFKDPLEHSFTVRSTPRPYAVSIANEGLTTAQYIQHELARAAHPVLIIDRKVGELHKIDEAIGSAALLYFDAKEENKTLEGALEILNFIVDERVTKESMVFVVGGGIVQDTAGFACGVLKRGVPWAYLPTTLLAQADSCIGSKTGLNFRNVKNQLGLFAAPRRVLVHPDFVSTLERPELLSGLGEIFKLCVTGGEECLATFEHHLDTALEGDLQSIRRMVALSLGVKRAVIEVDEFELDLRRSLNFGHSIGHALETVTQYAIPHGIAVSIGVLVECALAAHGGPPDSGLLQRLVPTVRRLLPDDTLVLMNEISFPHLLSALGQDKKIEGKILKLAVPVSLGRIDFVDFPISDTSIARLEESFSIVRRYLRLAMHSPRMADASPCGLKFR
jgi:3-dehydroquinate synthase